MYLFSFYYMKTLILCFFIKRGKGAEEGGGGYQNKDIEIAIISWGLHYNFRSSSVLSSRPLWTAIHGPYQDCDSQPLWAVNRSPTLKGRLFRSLKHWSKQSFSYAPLIPVLNRTANISPKDGPQISVHKKGLLKSVLPGPIQTD